MNVSYNVFSQMPFIPFNIIKHLSLSKTSDNIFKILKYNDYHCLSKEPLSIQEKMDMLWKYEDKETDFKIFNKPLVGDELTENTTQIRINKLSMTPTNHIISVIPYEFMFLTGAKIAMIEYEAEDGELIPISRIDYLESEILRELNGTDVGGVGTLQFNNELSRECRERLAVSNGKTFFGSTLVFAVQVSNIGGGNCVN